MSTKISTGFVPKMIELEGRVYRYAVWVPEDYDPGKKWPVILFLHGKGECGDDGEFHTTVGLGREIRKTPERFPALVVMPQIPVGKWWKGSMQRLALGALDATLKEYNADRDRIVLTGLSLGGFGTWSLGAKWTERFCALLPICGGGDVADAEQLARLPIWCYHGEADPVVAVSRSREMVAAVRSAGGNIKYTELPGGLSTIPGRRRIAIRKLSPGCWRSTVKPNACPSAAIPSSAFRFPKLFCKLIELTVGRPHLQPLKICRRPGGDGWPYAWGSI